MQKSQYARPGEKGFLENGPLISVVIPVYNMEKYLERCLESILKQSYQNLEIILVDDASTDDSSQIIKDYVDSDDRFKVVTHEKNMGLFQARISGADISTGKYLAFVDSDDYISIDWFRTLVRKAEQADADITVGEWCYDINGERREYHNLDPFRIKDFNLEGEEILKAFMEQEGTCFSWTVVWNKLYTKSLWNKCVDDFKQFSETHGHMLMWEDIAFSSALWAYANKVVNTHYAYYFYFKHKNASTAASRKKARNIKYLNDAASAMKFMKKILKKKNHFNELEKYYNNWNGNAASMLYHELVEELGLKYFKKQICVEFEYNGHILERKDFFYMLRTPLKETFRWYEDIIKKIISDETKYVSFDIFDTLIVRPFFDPTDLFELLSVELNKSLSSYVDFVQIRIDAEKMCRERINLNFPAKEEITLDEIYSFIGREYKFDKDLLDEVKKKEEELELKYCYERKIGKIFFELAKEAQKTIIICSDMYLDRKIIENILKKNGYKEFTKLYLSSEIRLTKSQNSLYAYIQRDLSCKKGKYFIHIGDNWDSDVTNPQVYGWYSGHISKTVDLLQNNNPGIYSGESFKRIFQQNSYMDNMNTINNFFGQRCVLALQANYLFDNPYISFNDYSDFNANPVFIGYFALGAHLLALSNWLLKYAAERDVPTIHFVARDGYLVKQAFDMLNVTTTQSNYIRLSRKALILADVNNAEDLYSLSKKINILQSSPKNLEEYFSPIIPENNIKDIPHIMGKYNLSYEHNFNNHNEFAKCVKVFIENILDLSLLPIYKTKLKKYFEQMVKPGDYIFDVGYNGRPEAALSNILGFPVGSFYIHINSDIAIKRQHKYSCPSEYFYQIKPQITGVIREHLLMELGPSTVGYKEINGKLEVEFENYQKDYPSSFITNVIQESALKFIQDYLDKFGDIKDILFFQKETLSAPLEYYLHHSKIIDREIFLTLPFEDNIGEGKVFKALDFWNNEISCISAKKIDNNSLLGNELAGLYFDGLFVKFYKLMNKIFPKGGKARPVVKKIAGIFIH